jgi:hypothetical protein
MSKETMKLALEALETYYGYMEPLLTVFGGPRVPAEQSTTWKVEQAITALQEALAEQPAPPPECQTEAEKTAYAFGWFKALESVREKPAQQEPVTDEENEKFSRDVSNFKGTDEGATMYALERFLKNRTAPQPAQQEPVAWMRQDGERVTTTSDRRNYPDYETRYSIPLYTSPPAQRKPLTDEQIMDSFIITPGMRQLVQAFKAGARFAEAAHGIKENT